MATGFSVFVNIGGKLNPSLAAAVGQAKAQVGGLSASLAGIGARLNAPFIAANKHLDATSKRMAAVQRKGRDMSLAVTAPAAWFGANMVKDVADFAKAGNFSEALGDIPKEQRLELEKIAQSFSAKYDAGGATGIMKTATELIKAGFTYAQARGSLEQVLAASALSGDMAAADLGAAISKSIVQFQLPFKTLEQASASSKVVSDRMVYAAVSTTASMRDMSESFKFAAGIASSTGSSLDQTTGLIMKFAQAGVLGSEAGVALRSALVRLVKMPKGGMAALSRIGMNLGDYTSARPITSGGIVGGLQAGGIDVSKSVEKQIAAIIKAGGGQSAQVAAITKAVQSGMGSSSAVDANEIAESVNAAYTAAGSKIDITRFFEDLRAKLESGAATTGDIAQILEARHISRYMALLRGDKLSDVIEKIGREADGYAEARYKIANQGLPAEILKLNSAVFELKNTLVSAVTPELVTIFDRIGASLKGIAGSNPAVLKLGIGFVAAAAAAGPLMFALGAIGRLGVFALKGLSTGLALLLAPIGMAARGIVGLTAALSVGLVAAVARTRAALAGLLALTAVGGAGTGLAAIGTGLLAFGRAVLTFPLVALRGVGLAMGALLLNPVGLVFTGLVTALAALGTWIANNWEGLKSFFAGFGDGFMKGLGPAAGVIKSIGDGLASAFGWLGKLLGPLDESGAKWKSWGETMGGAVAQGVNAVIDGIKSLIGFFGTVIEKAVALGGAIRNLWSAPKALPNAPRAAPPIAGARALGGPVTYGKPYLVGERGPELFVPGATGRIETNGALRQMTSSGAAAAAGSTTTTRTSTYSFSNHWTINGAENPRAIADQIDGRFRRLLADLESEQRGLLSD
ncbi:Phage tail tape measure protein [Rhodopseudomonas palustris HaA2]|uniref:Phage tail tape measure protein n=1 Tax=Rhodopseudomonas palustris (strain HaA2) TaxID=316058 RepID=Q2IUU9_RHOP2|nr:Phage tail tape measure protein [Rhodopseudomonas palustris HaA2]